MNDLKCDCAIVCGYPACEDGTPSPILKSRIDKAIELYQHRQIQYILVSGGAIHNQHNEAHCMAQYALKKGIPQAALIIEDQAKSTYHNMMYAKEKMKEYQLDSCFVVTNSWHMIKARYYAKKFHLHYYPQNAKKPPQMSYVTVLFYTIEMPINLLINRLKGYY